MGNCCIRKKTYGNISPDNTTDSNPILKNFNWETDDWPKWYYNYEDKQNKNTLISPF